MTTALDRLRADLATHRSELQAEEKRLLSEREQIDRQLQEISQALNGIDQMMGARVAIKVSKTTPAPDTSERDLLRKLMVDVVSRHPEGLTSYEILTQIQPNWTGNELSVRRIGTNAAAMPELTGDGQRWYYVPAKGGPEHVRA